MILLWFDFEGDATPCSSIFDHSRKQFFPKNLRPLNPVAASFLRTSKHPCYIHTGSFTPSIAGAEDSQGWIILRLWSSMRSLFSWSDMGPTPYFHGRKYMGFTVFFWLYGSLLMGVITPYITGRVPPFSYLTLKKSGFLFVLNPFWGGLFWLT